ncbi:hypothetical protein M406DRAFT_99819 [Cryphonectria parasitica EP155]|uniref:Exocyst complex component Sec3 PIP2-binding N-terminal domain-containing protein n=1 Tax=Cryphonectria parasitica (strain ATCC 38755 / EP155) TaxID=660469 RepID=A0A9P5CL62_CRYP1|nr:uncharacterized protein M406DRAFT_99819 [Cryphonectria parasitica EP155]KAF3761495.1 hypothetical protein M406DRAFT_99819 [Cryphonectria parasitica EP155]
MSGGMSRAERFEDEKRRIIDSCFSKREEDGSGMLPISASPCRLLPGNVYYTPQNSRSRNPQSEKPRVIIVAVRKSGRVRVHKTKENTNGTFSIGKTWNLDDLSAIESYTGPNVAPDARQWAGDNGFVVTLGKAYYWEAQTDREKKFFIASLIKIYGKYTGGRVPVLTNFDQRELDQVLGGAARRTPSAQQTPNLPSPIPNRPPASPARPPAPNAVPSFDGNGYAVPESSPASLAPSIDSARNFRSQDPALRQRLAVNNGSQDSVSIANKSGDEGFRPRSRGRPNGTSPYTNASEPVPPALAPAFVPTPSPSTGKPPERKRPPMDPLRPTGLPPDDNLVPAPLSSTTSRREASRGPSREHSPVAPPPRSIERMSPRKPSMRSQLSEATPPIDEITSKPVEPPPRLDTAPLKPDPNGAKVDSPAVPSPTVPPSASTTSETPTESPLSPEEEHRPGLGPMIRARKPKNELAGALWKAATAASVFKPRAGGAGEKLLKAAKTQSNGPDGITAVVPAPPRPEPEKKPESRPMTPEVPEVKVSRPDTSLSSSVQDLKTEPQPEPKKTPEQELQDERKRSIVVGNDMRYLTTLGVDPSILDKKTAQFTEWLDFFSWVPGDKMRSLNFDDMKIDLDRELNKAQAGGWLARFQEEDERVDGIKKGIDTAIEECEELDNLLTLYGVELSTLQDDIAYIEAQGQGLQVQAANQKLLKKELESLLETCAITANDLQALSTAPLDTADGVEDVETALVTLYKAMHKIDPSMGGSDAIKTGDASSDQAIDFNGDYAKMRIVQEKKQMYLQESAIFMQRLVEFMAREFALAYEEVRRALKGALHKKIDSHNHDAGRDLLWKYEALMLYARDVDLDNWNRLIQEYQDASHPTYKMEFRDALDSWKRNARKATGEEALLFTTESEKKEEGIATAARKLTVKRSQTLARIRSPLGESKGDASKSTIDLSRSSPYEVFAGVLEDLLPLVEMEQNFIVDFFHATTLEQIDFPDAVMAVSPRDRRGNDLRRHRLMEPDRDLARRVTRSMEVIFPFLEKDLGNLVDWVLVQSPLQGVGVMASIERKLADIAQSNQEFLNTVLQKVHGNLTGKFKRFVEDQIRAIEETKVKISKRKGVIAFMRVFPPFSMAVENMLVGIDPNLNVRRTIDREYDRILKSMFDSLKVIARENPAIGNTASGAGADPEDKEALNYHILLIENMHHYIEEVDTHGLETLERWKLAAQAEQDEHISRYLDAVMRRPLGKLLDQIENIEDQLKNGRPPAMIAMQASNNKATFDKVLLHYDAREVRKGIEALRKRVEKHFDESPRLAGIITMTCEGYYGEVDQRIGKIVTEVYGGETLVEWPRMEVKNAFRKGETSF